MKRWNNPAFLLAGKGQWPVAVNKDINRRGGRLSKERGRSAERAESGRMEERFNEQQIYGRIYGGEGKPALHL